VILITTLHTHDGTPFFWLADTWWYAPSDYMPFVGSSNPEIASCFKHCLDKRKEQGYNVIHFGFLGYLKGCPNPDSFYLTQEMDIEYWQETDKYIKYTIEQGIMPQVLLKWTMDNTLDDWEIIWRYFIARYGAYPITWDYSAEYNGPGKVAAGNVEPTLALGQLIKDIDPYKRIMTVMPWWYAGADDDPNFNIHWEQPWHDFTQVNGSHENPYSLPISKFQEAYDYNTPNPFILVETTFEGIQRNGFSAHNDKVVRRNFYRAMQCGGTGFTYGSHGLWYPTQDENDTLFESTWGDSIPWWEALDRPGGEQMGYLKTCYESLNWWQLDPNSDAVSAAGITDPNLYILTREGVIDSNNVYLIYFPPDVSATESASLTAEDGNYTATWFDPITADTNTLPDPLTVSGGTLTLPDRSDSNDWMLKMVQQP
jgi:hypothetical protein